MHSDHFSKESNSFDPNMILVEVYVYSMLDISKIYVNRASVNKLLFARADIIDTRWK